jgi:hypothetical protein
MGEARLGADPVIHLATLTNAFAERLRLIPELVADLQPADPASIIAYIDSKPDRPSLAAAKYSMRGGTVIIAAIESEMAQGEMAWWTHRVEFYVKAQSGQSTYQIIDDIMRGVPVPGDGQRWYLCPLAAGLDPTQVVKLARESDAEQVDYWTIYTETKETGDL